MNISPPKQKASGTAFNLGVPSKSKAASSPPKSTKGRGQQIKKFVDNIRSSKTFGPANFKQLRLTIGSIMKAEERKLLEALLPEEEFFADGIKVKFEKWLSKTQLEGEEQAPQKSKSLVPAIELEGFRFVPQAKDAIQVLFDYKQTRRSLTVTPGGKNLERHPDDFPDEADYCALLFALACDQIPEECSANIYNHLAFVTQSLNGKPMAQILGHVRRNLQTLPRNFAATVYEGLIRVDEEAAELWKRTANVAGVTLK